MRLEAAAVLKRALAFMTFRLDTLYKFMQGQKGLDALAEAARAI